MSRKTVVVVIVFLLALCAGGFAQETTTQETATQDTQATKKKVTPAAAKTQSAAKSGTTTAATKAQAAKSTTKETAKDQAASKKVPKDVVILKGAPMGGVKFLHTAHSKDRKIKCETCHHPSKTEKPATAAQQACSDCHTKTAAAPMKTKYQAAFHNPTATAGICIDCHKAENANGKKAPTKCTECHKKANV